MKKIELNNKGQISIPPEIREKMDELGTMLHKATSDLDHYQRFFALNYITELMRDTVDWKMLFKTR